MDLPDISYISKNIHNSQVFFTPRVSITWGKYGICEASLLALKSAVQTGNGYDYYHLMSGNDMPLCSINKLDVFFKRNLFNNPSDGIKTNYISIGKPSAKRTSRVKYYNFFINHWRDNNRITRKMATASNTLLCYAQKVFGIDRLANCDMELFSGSTWWSITQEFAEFYLSKSDWAKKQFGKATFAADEFVPQTVIMNSPFRKSCYKSTNNEHDNLRLLDFHGGNGYGSPKVWTSIDKDRLILSEDIFARKFDQSIDG